MDGMNKIDEIDRMDEMDGGVMDVVDGGGWI